MANSGAAAAMASLLPPHAVQLFIVSVSTYWTRIKPFTRAEPTLFLWLFRSTAQLAEHGIEPEPGTM